MNKKISGFIVVNKSNRLRYRTITTKSDFFRDPIVINIDEEKIIFKKVGFTDEGKIYHISRNRKTLHFHTTIACNISPGKYYFDEHESDEDRLVIHFRQS